MRGLLPAECQDDCLCYTKPALRKIADELTYAGICRYEVTKLREFATSGVVQEETLGWYQQPEIIVGGVVLSVSLGFVVGLVVGGKK